MKLLTKSRLKNINKAMLLPTMRRFASILEISQNILAEVILAFGISKL